MQAPSFPLQASVAMLLACALPACTGPCDGAPREGPPAESPRPRFPGIRRLIAEERWAEALAELEPQRAAAEAAGDDWLLAAILGQTADVLIRDRQFDVARVHLDRAVELDPGYFWLHYARGTCLREMGELESAVQAYSEALGLNPRHIKSFQWRGEVRNLLRNHLGAIEDFTIALELTEEAEEQDLLSWGGRRQELIRYCLLARARAWEAVGDHEAAAEERARAGR